MASLEHERDGKVNFELLALFDDVSALSEVENSSLDTSYFDFLYEDHSTPKMDDRWETKMNDQQTLPKKDGNENTYVFAVPKMYNCLFCRKRFYSRTASRRHQICHAKQQLRCPCCKARSYSISALRRHYEYFHYCERRRQILIEAQ